MSTITWAVTADMDRDGDYEEDLTDAVRRPGAGIRIRRGFSPEGVYVASQLTIGLGNEDGAFTPNNSSSSYYGMLKPGLPIRITATHATLVYTVWTGYLRRSRQAWSAGQARMVEWECGDIAESLAEIITTGLSPSTSRNSGSAIAAIAAAIGLSSDAYRIDTGKQSLPVHFSDAQIALNAMQEAARSELGGLLWVDAFGRLRFDHRRRRLSVSRYQQEVLRDNPGVYIRLNDPTTASARDYSGNGQHGTYNGAPTLSAAGALTGDATGYAVALNGGS